MQLLSALSAPPAPLPSPGRGCPRSAGLRLHENIRGWGGGLRDGTTRFAAISRVLLLLSLPLYYFSFTGSFLFLTAALSPPDSLISRERSAPPRLLLLPFSSLSAPAGSRWCFPAVPGHAFRPVPELPDRLGAHWVGGHSPQTSQGGSPILPAALGSGSPGLSAAAGMGSVATGEGGTGAWGAAPGPRTLVRLQDVWGDRAGDSP